MPGTRSAHGGNGRNGTRAGGSKSAREAVCAMLRAFYAKDWVSGTGGGLCLKTGDALLLAPTGVHKERVQPDDLFLEDLRTGQVLRPANPNLKPTECAPIFRAVIRARRAGAVAHTHALSAVLAADTTSTDELRLERLEMLKGIAGCDNAAPHLVPVIRNTARESELTGSIEAALAEPRFHKASCVLVKDHGAYVWGADLDEAKKHAEVYHFLFEAHRARHAAQRGVRA